LYIATVHHIPATVHQVPATDCFGQTLFGQLRLRLFALVFCLRPERISSDLTLPTTPRINRYLEHDFRHLPCEVPNGEAGELQPRDEPDVKQGACRGREGVSSILEPQQQNPRIGEFVARLTYYPETRRNGHVGELFGPVCFSFHIIDWRHRLLNVQILIIGRSCLSPATRNTYNVPSGHPKAGLPSNCDLKNNLRSVEPC